MTRPSKYKQVGWSSLRLIQMPLVLLGVLLVTIQAKVQTGLDSHNSRIMYVFRVILTYVWFVVCLWLKFDTLEGSKQVSKIYSNYIAMGFFEAAWGDRFLSAAFCRQGKCLVEGSLLNERRSWEMADLTFRFDRGSILGGSSHVS